MTSPDPEARTSYTAGVAPLDYIENATTDLIESWVMLRAAARVAGRGVFHSRNLTPETLARRITAAYLNAGWTPPEAGQ